MPAFDRSTAVRRLGEGAVILAAAGFAAFAVLCGRGWLERHFLPEFFQPRGEQMAILNGLRLGAAVLAVLLVAVARPRVGRWIARRGAGGVARDVLPYAVAVLLALGVSELALRQTSWRANHQAAPTRAPHRQWDTRLGWVNVPDHVSRGPLGGRIVEYAFDRAGHRVARPGDGVDYAAPSVLFVGESIIVGHGLHWPETLPARVQAATGLQAANLGVGGYAIDQEYLRLLDELPRFRRPRAVVVFFMPSLMHRLFDTDRPHLTRGLRWRPADGGPRLVQVARRLAPYHSAAGIAEGEATAGEMLEAAVAAIRARGATPLILVPQLTPETAEERAIRRRLLDAPGLPYLCVRVDPSFHLPHNRHPDARGDAVLADAVLQRLRAEGAIPEAPSPGDGRAEQGLAQVRGHSG